MSKSYSDRYRNDPEFRERERARGRAYYRKNRDTLRAKSRKRMRSYNAREDVKARKIRWAAERAKKHRAILGRYKLLCGCDICGRKDGPSYAYDFDHRDPNTKSFTVAGALTHRWEDVKAEVRKCRVLCAFCHRIHTHESAPHSEE